VPGVTEYLSELFSKFYAFYNQVNCLWLTAKGFLRGDHKKTQMSASTFNYWFQNLALLVKPLYRA